MSLMAVGPIQTARLQIYKPELCRLCLSISHWDVKDMSYICLDKLVRGHTLYIKQSTIRPLQQDNKKCYVGIQSKKNILFSIHIKVF